METETPAVVSPKVQMVYIGVDANCTHHRWMELTGTENDGEPLVLRGKEASYGVKRRKQTSCNNIAPAGPGAIYEFEKTDTGVMIPGKYVGGWKNKDDVVMWQAESRANELAKKAKDDEGKANSRRHDREALEPFRQAYANANNFQRGLILADIVHYVTSGRKPKKSTDEDDY